MKGRLWDLHQLKAALAERTELNAWIAHVEHVHRRERYALRERHEVVLEQDREVQVENVTLRVAVKKPTAGRQGESSLKLSLSQPLTPQLSRAIAAAQQTDVQAWSLPAALPHELPQLKSADPRIAERIETTMTELSSELRDMAAENREACFNSAELFLSSHDFELHLSNGLVHRSAQTRAYAEAAFSAECQESGRVRSDEFYSELYSVAADDLDLRKLFGETALAASQTLKVCKPEPGRYAVLLHAEALSLIFASLLPRLSGINSYHHLPFVKPGESLIPGASGDLISLSLDPFLDWGASTLAVSPQGIAVKPVSLVQANRVAATAVDQQYAEYLGLEPNTSRGNIVIEAGTKSYEELTREEPLVLEVLQFSALNCDPNSGTFSSEIRLARLHDRTKGTSKYLKGGSLSGAILENFTHARFSKTRTRNSYFNSNELYGRGYFGPEYALLNDVSIVG